MQFNRDDAIVTNKVHVQNRGVLDIKKKDAATEFGWLLRPVGSGV